MLGIDSQKRPALVVQARIINRNSIPNRVGSHRQLNTLKNGRFCRSSDPTAIPGSTEKPTTANDRTHNVPGFARQPSLPKK